jgi:hypothetical protein
MPRIVRSGEQAVTVTLARLGKMEGDECATFSPFPGDCHPPAGHPLAALRRTLVYRPGNIGAVLTEHHRGPTPKRSAPPPNNGASAQRGQRSHRRYPPVQRAPAPGHRRAGNHGACSLLCGANARRAAVMDVGLDPTASLPSDTDLGVLRGHAQRHEPGLGDSCS